MTPPVTLRDVQQHISLGQLARAAEELSRLPAAEQFDLLETLPEAQAAGDLGDPGIEIRRCPGGGQWQDT